MPHTLYISCHLILPVILYPQYLSLKLRLRELTPLTQRHTATLPGLDSSHQTHTFGQSPREKGLVMSSEHRLQCQSHPRLSGTPSQHTHSVRPPFLPGVCAHSSFSEVWCRPVAQGGSWQAPQSLLLEIEFPVKEAHCVSSE